MNFGLSIYALEQRLKKPLPGRNAQLKMASMVRIQKMIKSGVPKNAIQSSVLILLYPHLDTIGMVLMLRPQYQGIHSGQISLPGGKAEHADKDSRDTALRESKEEIGINPTQIKLLGKLTDLYIPPSNYLVSPYIGYQESHPKFHPDPAEVAKIIEITLDELLDSRNIRKKRVKLVFGLSLTVPAFYIDHNIIWGATAMILSEFRELFLEALNIACEGTG